MRPSGRKAFTYSFAECVVSRLGVPPCSEIRNTSKPPSRSDEKAICFPSGDHTG